MVTVVILVILVTVGLPVYQNYLKKGHAQSAGADLVALSLVMENTYQRTLQYAASSTASTSATISYAASGSTAQPWVPSQSAYFNYMLNATASTYTLTASGLASSVNSGCVLTLDSANNRVVSGSTACGGLTSW